MRNKTITENPERESCTLQQDQIRSLWWCLNPIKTHPYPAARFVWCSQDSSYVVSFLSPQKQHHGVLPTNPPIPAVVMMTLFFSLWNIGNECHLGHTFIVSCNHQNPSVETNVLVSNTQHLLQKFHQLIKTDSHQSIFSQHGSQKKVPTAAQILELSSFVTRTWKWADQNYLQLCNQTCKRSEEMQKAFGFHSGCFQKTTTNGPCFLTPFCLTGKQI